MSGTLDELLQVASELSAEHQETVLAFAAFLRARSGPVERPPLEPLNIPRPTEESVIAAIRRLAETYPMLNRRSMMSETSALMMEHVMKGKPAEEIIDRLEILFRETWETSST